MALFGNEGLLNLDALSGAAGGANSMTIRNNPRLMSLAGLVGLTSVATAFDIQGSALTGLDGLEALQSVGALSLYDNPALASLDGLSSLSSISQSLYIADNPSLPTCTAQSLRDRIGPATIPGEVVLCGNLSDSCGSEVCP